MPNAAKTTSTRSVRHPFQGGVSTRGITKSHVPLVWENMLGTVYARNPETSHIKYFDYDYDAAHEYAQVHKATDLRVSKAPASYSWGGYAHDNDHEGPAKGKLALWGVHPKRQWKQDSLTGRMNYEPVEEGVMDFFKKKPAPEKGRTIRPAGMPMTSKGADRALSGAHYDDIDPETVPIFKPEWPKYKSEAASYATMLIANGVPIEEVLKRLESGEIEKPARRGFLRMLGASPLAPSAIVKAALPAVAQAATQAVVHKVVAPPSYQQIHAPHIHTLLTHAAKDQGFGDNWRADEIGYDEESKTWGDTEGNVGYHSKKLGGHVSYYDKASQTGGLPHQRVYSRDDLSYPHGYHLDHDVYFKPDGSDSIEKHKISIDMTHAPHPDDFEDSTSGMHQWYKKQIHDRLPGVRDWVKVPEIATKHGYKNVDPNEFARDYVQGSSSGRHGREWEAFARNHDMEHLTNVKVYTARKGGGGRSLSDLDNFHDLQGLPTHVIFHGQNKRTGAHEVYAHGPDYPVKPSFKDSSDLDTSLANEHKGF